MSQLKFAIIVGSTREGRVSPQVAQWYQKQASAFNNHQYDILDVKEYGLPFLGESSDTSAVEKWNQDLAKYDGFIFVTAEYNRSIPASLKNAIDSAGEVWNNKPAGVVSYGSVNGARAAEHLRGIFAELQIADVRAHVSISMFTDFENWSVFKPQALHQANLEQQLTQLDAWGRALKTIR